MNNWVIWEHLAISKEEEVKKDESLKNRAISNHCSGEKGKIAVEKSPKLYSTTPKWNHVKSSHRHIHFETNDWVNKGSGGM